MPFRPVEFDGLTATPVCGDDGVGSGSAGVVVAGHGDAGAEAGRRWRRGTVRRLMAPAQMALPVDRRNGASAPGPPRRPAGGGASRPVAAAETSRPAMPVGAGAGVGAAGHHGLGRGGRRGGGGARATNTCVLWRAGRGGLAVLAAAVSVDGLAVAASMTMLVRRRAGAAGRGAGVGWRCCSAWGPRWRRTSPRRNRPWRAGWWRRGRRSGCCSAYELSDATDEQPGAVLASKPSAPVLSNPSMEVAPMTTTTTRPCRTSSTWSVARTGRRRGYRAECSCGWVERLAHRRPDDGRCGRGRAPRGRGRPGRRDGRS